MNDIAYLGRVTDKKGRTIFKTVMTYPTREEAAANCFMNRPRARVCSTERVTIRVIGGQRYVFTPGADIRFHQRTR
jgi:hypothetical protein